MFPQTKSKTLNRATILMMCLTSLLLLFTTLNQLGDDPPEVE